jgi:hypothetical protein
MLALVAALAGAGWWLLAGDLFALSRVETGGYRFTDKAALESCLARLLGHNAWTLREADVAEALAPLPWVRGVTLHRQLPDRLHLEIHEWRPLVILASANPAATPLVLVADGRVLEFPADLVPPALPVLTGVAAAADSSGTRRLPQAEEQRLLSLLAAVESSGLEAHAPVDFVVAREQGYAIVLAGGAGTLLVGREMFADRLERYLTARDHLAPGLEVDLRFRDRVTVRRPGS